MLAVVFNVALPKGGFALYGVPITWGYIVLAILIVVAALNSLLIKKINTYRLQSYLLTLPFTIYFIIYLFYIDTYSAGGGYIISAIISFVIFPLAFIVLFEKWIQNILDHFDFFHKLILRSILFLSVFGIILFIYKAKTGIDFEIPYLTINAKDSGLMGWKHNGRSNGFFKLISTYNNGNIFGVCMLFLLPFTKKHKWHKLLLKSAIILSLSRTVWAGLIIYELISYRKNFVKMFSFGLGFLTSILFGLIFILKKDLSFLLDPTLNGRLDGKLFEKIHIFLYDKDFKGISEMTYKSVLEQMGIVGLMLFVIHVFSPLIINHIYKLSKNKNQYINQLEIGILSYLITAFIDGAYLLIPVSVFLWFFNSLILTSSR